MQFRAIHDFQRPTAIAKSRAEGDGMCAALDRLDDEARSRDTQAVAALALAESRVAASDERLARLHALIAASVVRAEAPGIVMHREGYFGIERRKPQIGDQIAPNQPVLPVPDTSRLVVEIHVREIDVRKIAVGNPVTVRPDAFPDLAAPATVTAFGTLPIEDLARAGTRRCISAREARQ